MLYAQSTGISLRESEKKEEWETNKVRITVDGVDTPEEKLNNVFVFFDRHSDGTTWFYMPDFIFDADGHLVEIRYIKVYH